MSVPERGQYLEIIQFHDLHIEFDTPDLLTGVAIYVPRVGDVILPIGYIDIPEAWNGTTPTMNLFSEGNLPSTDGIVGGDMTLQNNDSITGGHVARFGNTAAFPPLLLKMLDETPLMIAVGDGTDSGDPGSTQGVANIVICVGTIS